MELVGSFCQPRRAGNLVKLKNQLLDGYASQGPLRQSDPAGAIQSPGVQVRSIRFFDFYSSVWERTTIIKYYLYSLLFLKKKCWHRLNKRLPAKIRVRSKTLEFQRFPIFMGSWQKKEKRMENPIRKMPIPREKFRRNLWLFLRNSYKSKVVPTTKNNQ